MMLRVARVERLLIVRYPLDINAVIVQAPVKNASNYQQNAHHVQTQTIYCK